jgi:DNA topoisomerase IA
MGKSLVIAEKPSVGREIAKILNFQQKCQLYYSGSK